MNDQSYGAQARAAAELEERGPSGMFWTWFWVIVVGALVLRVGLALSLPNVARPDEIFQNLEPAFRMWSGHGVMTWDWREGIRSPVFPGILALLIAACEKLGMGAAGYVAVITVVMGLVSTCTVAIGYLLGWRLYGQRGAILCSVLCTVWVDLVYFGPKALAEVQAGNLLVIAAYLAMYTHEPIGRRMRSALKWEPSAARLMTTGFLLGLVFCMRFHLALLLLLVAVWACRLEFRKRWMWMALGFLVPALAMGLADLHYSGMFFYSVWKNFQMNIGQSVSKEYGTDPFYFFFVRLAAEWRLATLAVFVTFLVGFRKAPLLGWVAVGVILFHSLIAHKEISFIYAALPSMLLVCGLGTMELIERLTRAGSVGARVAVAAAVVVWAALSFTAATGKGFGFQWHVQEPQLRAEASLRNEPGVCGVAIHYPEAPWYSTGGDYYMGKPVPIYAFSTAEGAKRVLPAVNYALGGRDLPEELPGFVVKQCWNGRRGEVCMAAAPAGKSCVADPAFDLNGVLKLGRVGTEAGADVSPQTHY